jgi:uncharacterized protein (TIGR03435 family)
LIGGPDWIGSERYDVTAKALDGTPVTRDAINLLVQRLLYDRFNLQVHQETREFPAYNLTLARTDGRLGPRIKPSTVQCAAAPAAGNAAPPPPPLVGEVPCGTNVGFGRITAGRRTLAQLARTLADRLGRIVIDKTGVAEEYDFVIEFTPDNAPNIPPDAQPAGVTLPAKDGPSLMTALEEQLGLKLESARQQIEVVVIDSVERPTPD